MEIKIRKNGNAAGTVGWLAKGLESGDIEIYEGIQKDNGFHGLWMKGKDLSKPLFLAGFNQFGLSTAEYDRAAQYEVADEHFTPRQFSTACWESIMEIAESWCDECNELLDKEETISVKHVRIEEVTA